MAFDKIKRVGLGVSTGGLSELKGLMKPTTIEADPFAEQLRKNQEQYAGMQKAAINEFNANATPEAVQSQIGKENSALQGNLADIRRRVQQNIARQGLQNTSLGLNAMVKPEREIAQQINLNNVSGNERMMDLAIAAFLVSPTAVPPETFNLFICSSNLFKMSFLGIVTPSMEALSSKS